MKVVPALALSAVVTIGLALRSRPPRLAIERFPRSWRLWAAMGLLVGVLALTVFLPLDGLVGEVVPPDPDDMPFYSLFAGHALLAGFLLLWWGLAGFEAPARFLRLPLEHPARRIAIGLAAGLGAWLTTITAMAIIATALGIGAGGGADDGGAAGDSVAGIPEVVRFIVGMAPWRRALLVISAGVFEEAFFRAFLQSRGGLLLSTLLFTMSHASYGLPFMLVGVFTVSLVLGFLFRAGGDVLPCMVAHGVFDAVQLFVVLPLVVSGS